MNATNERMGEWLGRRVPAAGTEVHHATAPSSANSRRSWIACERFWASNLNYSMFAK